MKFLIVLFALIGVTFASTLIPAALTYRAPEFDSAIIQSDRLGGNFAYSTVEGHAYKSIAPVVQDVIKPVAVTYNTHYAALPYAAHPYAYAHPGHIIY